MRNVGFAPPQHGGWYLAATVDELTGPITALSLAGRSLMVVSTREGGFRVYDAVCPHRGASLAHGGTLARAGVICPFHGKAVALGACADPDRYAVAEMPSLLVGPVLFVALGPVVDDRGFTDTLQALARTHDLYPCPPMLISVAPELVVENAFDLDHFMQVHRISRVAGKDWGQHETGAAYCDARFTVRTPEWDGGGNLVIHNRFYARAFSPTIVLSELGEPGVGQTVITGATPTGRGSVVRVINALRRTEDGVPPAVLASLTEFAGKALRDDTLIWEHMDMAMTPRMDRRDAPVIVFRDFCDSFAPASAVVSTTATLESSITAGADAADRALV